MVIKIRSGNVNQFRRLFLDSFHYLRMAVSCRANRDARSEIQERVSVYVFDDRAVASLGYERVFASQRRRHELGVGGDDLLRLRPRQRRDEARCFYF